MKSNYIYPTDRVQSSKNTLHLRHFFHVLNCTETEINNELENVNVWLKQNKLSLNAQKTKLMVFHRKQKKFNEIYLSIDTMPIEQEPTINFLGITLDETLSWKITPKSLQIKFLG